MNPGPSLEMDQIEVRRDALQNAYTQASNVIKAVLLFNGGGTVAILSFLSATSKSNEAILSVCVHDIRFSFLFYVSGSVAALTCAFLSLLSAAMHAHHTYQWHEGYDKSFVVRLVAVASCILSLLCFSMGSYWAVMSIGPC